MNVPSGRATLHAGSAAVTNLLRLARTESDATVAFAAVSDDGGTRIFAVPPPGAPGALVEDALEELAHQLSHDPELPRARVVVRWVQRDEPLTVAASPIPGLAPPSLVAVVGDAHRSFDERQSDAIHRVATRLGRHFEALRELGSAGAAGVSPVGPSGVEWEVAADAVVRNGGPAPATDVPGASATDDEPELDTPALASDERTPSAGPAAGRTTVPSRPSSPPAPEGEHELWWSYPDPLTGLPSIAQFFSRVGRLLASDARGSGAFALVLVDIPTEQTAPAAARALAAQLRFNDPLARVARTLFAAGALLLPGSTRGDAVEERLGSAVRGALEWLSPVHTTHVLAEPGDRRDADELLRQAISGLSGRTTGGGGAPWRGAGGSAARLPFP